MQRAEEYLRIIERTRLLYNTSAELGEVVGFSIGSGNGLARKGGRSAFMKDAILRELIYMTEERTGLDLERVLEAYVEADDIMQAHKRVLRGKDVCRQLIRHFYAEEAVAEKLVAVTEKLRRRDIPLLVLMLEGALPALSAKGGDVESIAEDYHRVFLLLKGIVCTDIHLRSLPMLTEMETWANKNPEDLCRIDLIDCVFIILEAYGGISTPANLSLTSLKLQSQRFIPDLDGIWTEDEESTVFWQFEAISNGHYLRRYTLNSERRELTYTEYSFQCLDEGDSILAVVMHPHIVHCIVHQITVPNELCAYLDMTINEGSLTFEPVSVDSQWLRLKSLKKSEREDFFLKILEDPRYSKVNMCSEDEYTFTQALAAITEDALFIETDDEKYLRVPKDLHPQLEDVQFNEDVGIIKLQDATFVAFDTRLLYFEVTSDEQRRQLGISFLTIPRPVAATTTLVTGDR